MTEFDYWKDPISEKQLQSLVEDARFNEERGFVASYIPELRLAMKDKIGVVVHYTDGTVRAAGNWCGDHRDQTKPLRIGDRNKDDRFTIQSISKVLALLYVLETVGEEVVFRRILKEPTGDAYNADPRVRARDGKRMPYNPMINVGAIFITSLFPDPDKLPANLPWRGSTTSSSPVQLSEGLNQGEKRSAEADVGTGTDARFYPFFDFVRHLCGDHTMVVDADVFGSEKKTGHNNRSLAWKMNADGIFIRSPAPDAEAAAQDVEFIETVLDNYFRQCSILVHAGHLARVACILAKGGIDPESEKRVVRAENVTSVVSLMSSCGLYDGSGEFSYDIGVAAKSGVGGGIMACVPGRAGIAVFSPALNDQGNSARGLYILRALSEGMGLHMFHKEPTSSRKFRKYNSDKSLDELSEILRFGFTPPSLKPASYIPELQRANARDTGIAICFTDGECIGGGDVDKKFSMQAISNVFGLLYVMRNRSEGTVFGFVGKEPSGESFQELKWTTIEEADGRRKVPFNPMINAGAIVIASMIPDQYRKPDGKSVERLNIDGLLSFVRELCDNPEITTNESVFESERKTGFNNRSLAWLMNDKRVFADVLRGHQIDTIENEHIEAILDVYFRLCSLEVTCKDLARFGAVLANSGRLLGSEKRVLSEREVKVVTAMMSSAGLYDGSGEFAYRAGIPTKSGISGGLVGVVPGRCGLAAYSPVIDERGNSYRGQKAFVTIADAEGLSLFTTAIAGDDGDIDTADRTGGPE